MPVAALVASTKARSGIGPRFPSRLCTGLGIAAVLGQLVEHLMRQSKSWTPAVRIAILLNFGASVGLAGASGCRRVRTLVVDDQRIPSECPEFFVTAQAGS